MDHSLIFIVKQMWFTISYDHNLIIRAGYFGCIWIGKLQCEETVITICICIHVYETIAGKLQLHVQSTLFNMLRNQLALKIIVTEMKHTLYHSAQTCFRCISCILVGPFIYIYMYSGYS